MIQEQLLEIGGKPVRLYAHTGILLDANQYTQTHISSSGGGGYIHPERGGYVAPPQIHSTIINHQEFWIEDRFGQVTPVQFYDSNIPMRPGHLVSLILVESARGGPFYCGYVDHTVGRWWGRGHDGELVTNLRIFPRIFSVLPILIPALLSIIALYLGLNWEETLGVAFAAFVPATLWAFFIGYRAMKKLTKAKSTFMSALDPSD
ncbi:MAG: hypothetical protein ACPG1C_08555 [Alphaproteobacteria bacterium]